MGRVFLSMVFCLVLAAGGEVFFPAVVHSGRLLSVERVSGKPAFLTAEAVLAGEEANGKHKQKTPPYGMVHVELKFQVLEGRSLSVCDYLLSVDGGEYPCLGMRSEGAAVYDRRKTTAIGPETVVLLYCCPESAETGELAPVLGLPLAVLRNVPLKAAQESK